MRHAGVRAEQYATTVTGAGAQGRLDTLSLARVAALNHAQLPLGTVRDGGRVPTRYADAATLTVWLDVRTDRVLDLRWTERVTAQVQTAGAFESLATPVAGGAVQLPTNAVSSSVAAADSAASDLEHRSVRQTLTGWSVALAVVALLAAVGFGLTARRRLPSTRATTVERVQTLVRS